MDSDEENGDLENSEDQIIDFITLDSSDPQQQNGFHDEPDQYDNFDPEILPENSAEMSENSENMVDMSRITFDKHSGDVFSVDFGSNYLAASGGEDDKAFMWNYESGEVVMECSGHSDSVTWVRFNAKKTLLATGDMSGRIQIWDIEKRGKVTEFTDSADLEWLRWHSTADILFAGANDGIIWMWLIPTKDCRLFSAVGSPCTDGKLLQDGKRLVAGYADGHVRIWDLKTSEWTKVNPGIVGQPVHNASINCVDCSTPQPIAASAAVDGAFSVFNVDTAKVLASFQVQAPKTMDANDDDAVSGSEENDRNSIETLCFHPDSNILATGTVSGRLDIWDLNSGVSRLTCDHPDGIVKAQWKSSDSILTACLDGILRLWDCRNGQILKEWTGHSGEILDFVVSENVVLTGSGDKRVKVYEI